MSSKKIARIGILVGDSLSPNIEVLLYNLGRMLSDHFKMDLIGDFKISNRLKMYYNYYPLSSLRYNGPILGYFFRFVNNLINCLRYVNDKDPDILFQITKYPIYSPIVSIIGKIKRIPVLLRYAGDNFNEYKLQSTLLSQVKLFIRNNLLGTLPLLFSDKVIALNSYGKEQLMNHGCKEGKIEIIPQPIDTEKFFRPKDKKIIRKKLDLPLDKKIVLYVGRLSRLKGMKTFLNVIPEVGNKRNMLFLFIGKGEYCDELKKLGRNIRIIEGVPHDAIPEYYQASDLLVHPSLTEGISNTMLEAISCGLPVLARDISSIKSFGVETFESDSELKCLLLKEERRPAELPTEFDWEKLMMKYIRIFEKLLTPSTS